MGLGLAYGHIGSQGIDDIFHGGDIARTILWTFGPTVAGTGLGYLVSKSSDSKHKEAWIVGGTLAGAIGSSIYQTYKDDEDGKTKFSKNTNFYMTFVLAIAVIAVTRKAVVDTAIVDTAIGAAVNRSWAKTADTSIM